MYKMVDSVSKYGILLKVRIGVKYWLFQECVVSCMSYLSTADCTVGALVNEVQLSDQPNWCWSQPILVPNLGRPPDG